MPNPSETTVYSRGVKRIMDITGALAGLVLLAPVIAATALVAAAALGRPVLFRQVRPGLNAKPFTLYKFRTMRQATGPDGEPLPDAERLTAVGRFLRAASLDELPTLWNVVRGDMSLVGPRPLLQEYLPLYTPEQWRRHELRPGITGWAQVHGRNAVSWERKFGLDVWYVDNCSLALDLRILALTAAKVVRREGISQPGVPTAERFRGTSD
jgi:sugar transferase EpsL